MAATIARWKATLVASSIVVRQWRRVWPTLALAISVPIHASGAMRIIALLWWMLIVVMAMAAMRAAAATMQQRRASGQGEAFTQPFRGHTATMMTTAVRVMSFATIVLLMPTTMTMDASPTMTRR